MELWSRISCRNRSKFRGSFNGVCVSVLIFFLYKDQIIQKALIPKKPSLNFPQKSTFKFENPLPRRRIYENSTSELPICTEIHEQKDSNSKCEYLKSHPECNSGGYFNYMMFFYCECNNIEPLGYALLFIWLIALLYLLGNTAADYFCCSLEMLSNLLKLPPTVAGVTLLPLGNGAPDVFASIAAFVGSDSGDVGLNSVLGGAIFVTCIVVGAVCLCVAETNVQIDRKCFVRDVGFFLIALVSLLVILLVGEVSFGGAIVFVSVYVVYALCVAGTEIFRKYGRRLKLQYFRPLLPVTDEAFENSSLLQCGDDDDTDDVPFLQSEPPHWLWAIYSNEPIKTSDGENRIYLWGWNQEEDTSSEKGCVSFSNLCSLIEMPLAIPRRLTIPIVEEGRWSKVFGVASAFFAPVLCTFLWGSSEVVYIISGATIGATLGLLALIYTSKDHPPRACLLPWVIGGFVMSIVWFYIIANELVALLVALGLILKIKASLLGLTILAWGNSMGDLVSNVAIATNGGNGVQVAMSGCYAGPMFNALVGLGLSLLIAAWSKKPGSYVVPKDSSLYFTLGFLMLSLVWALVVLPRNDMRPTRLLGIGLIVIYLGFLSLRVSMALGDGSFS